MNKYYLVRRFIKRNMLYMQLLLLITLPVVIFTSTYLKAEATPTTTTTTSTTISTSTTTTTTTTTEPIQIKPQISALPTTTTAPPAQTYDCEQYRELVAKYFPENQINNALLVMSKESGCRPDAKSPSNDHGLMQIHWPAHKDKVDHILERLYDPETNIRVARQIYGNGSWKPWYAVCPIDGSNPYGLC